MSQALRSAGSGFVILMATAVLGTAFISAATGSRSRSLTVVAVAISPDGKSLAAAGMGRPIALWDLGTGKVTRKLAKSTWEGVAAFSADGKYLFSSCPQAGVVRLSVSGDDQPTPIGGTEDRVMAIASTPDGKTLAWANMYQDLVVWDVSASKEKLRIPFNKFTWSLSLSPDGKLLATASQHDKVARVWDTTTGKEAFILPDAAVTVAFSPDGKTIATSGYPKAKLWDVASQKELRSLDGWGCLAFSPDGKTLATGAMHLGEVSWWDAATGKKLHTVSGEMEIMSLAFSPDGKTLAGGDNRGDVTGGRVYLWDVATGEKKHTLPQP